MKALYESILDDIENTLEKGNDFVNDIDDEFKIIKSIKNLTCWNRIKTDGGNCIIYEYNWDCKNTMKSLGNEKRNRIEIGLQYIVKNSVFGKPGWILTILLKPNPPVIYKDGYAQQIFRKEFKITDFKNTNDLIKNYLLKDIFADYKTFSKFYNENKPK